MTPHISASKEDIANLVLMPGDPKRAKFIAENYLSNYKLVSDVRNIYAYTGTYKNKKVSVIASGMGMPSMAIYAYELFSIYNVSKIIRVGTCGSLKESVKVKDILLAENAYTNSNFTYSFDGSIKTMINSSDLLNKSITDNAIKNNIDIKNSNIFTTDLFYTVSGQNPRSLYNCDGIEMETFALLYIANHFKKEATSILTVSDSEYEEKDLSPIDRETSLNDSIFLALESL